MGISLLLVVCSVCFFAVVTTGFQQQSKRRTLSSSSARQSSFFTSSITTNKQQQQQQQYLSYFVISRALSTTQKRSLEYFQLYSNNNNNNSNNINIGEQQRLLDNDDGINKVVGFEEDNSNTIIETGMPEGLFNTKTVLPVTAALVSAPYLFDTGSSINSITSTLAWAEPILDTSKDSFFSGISQGNLNPATFQPVCAASDSFYRVLQQTTLAIVGKENFIEYGPLIAGGLLRVRLELCVVESFFNEAVGPFIAQNGLSWVLPIHETVETFLAGGIFAIATTFILVGSTKLLTVVATYTDFVFGFPSRFFGGFIFDRAIGKPVTIDLQLGPWFRPRLFGPPKPKDGQPDPALEKEYKIETNSLSTFVVLAIFGIIKFFGETLKFIRELLEGFDYFVGRYLVLAASFYILIKFLHFKVFPDFP